MPNPKYTKLTQAQLDDWYLQNKAWADSKGYSKELAQRIYLTKNLYDQGANYGVNPSQFDRATLERLYDEGFDGPNPYKQSAVPTQKTLGPNAVDLDVNEETQNSMVAPDGSIISNSVLDSHPERFQYSAQPDQTYVRSRYNFESIRQEEDLEGAKRSKALENQLRTQQGQMAFSSIKQEMSDFLKDEGNTFYTGKYSDHFDNDYEGAKDWWYYAASYYQRLKEEQGELSAKSWLNQAVRQRVMDTQSGWEATQEIPQQFINNFVSGAASDIGILWGVGAGFFRAAFDQDEDLGFWQEWGKNIIDNDFMNYANAVMEQGRLKTTKDFNPEIDMGKSFIASQNVGASGFAQTAYGLSSLAVGGVDKLVTKGIKTGVESALRNVVRNEGRYAARQARIAASRSATKLAEETEEEFVKRQAKLARQRKTRDIIGDQAISAHMAFGEAGLDANDTYHQVLEYSEQATDAAAKIQAENRLREELGIEGDVYEWLDKATKEILNNEAQQGTGDYANAGNLGYSADEYNKVFNGLRNQVMQKLMQYTEEEQAKLDDVHSNNLAVAIKTGMLTLGSEGLTVWAADGITDHTLSRESHRNLRRRHGMGNTRTQRGLTWNEATGRVEVNLPTTKQEWASATGKWALDATVGEVLPENLQNLFSQTSQAIGMNAVDQYIVARSNGEEAEIGDLHFGDDGLKNGLKAGWKAMKEEAANTSIITYLSTLMPNLNPTAIRGIVHRPDNVSVGEHLSNLLGNGITRNYFEEINKDKHVRFYNDEINKILDDAPWLQDALQEGITLNNFNDMVNQAYNAGDMAAAEQAELGQLVTLLSHMNAVNVENSPLAFIDKKIERIVNASSDEEKTQLVTEHLKKNPSLLRADETIETLSDERKQYFFDEMKENAQRMKGIQESVKQASDTIRENFSTYDERVQNALIFGKVFNETLQSDIDAERQKLQTTVSQSTTSQTAPDGSVTMDAITNQRKIVRLNQEQDQLSRIQSELAVMQQLAEKGSEKEILDYVSKAYANNPRVTVNSDNFMTQFNRRLKAYAKEEKRQAKTVKRMAKDAKGITETKIHITANDLINGNAEVRRFLLNANNWSLLSTETQKQLKAITDELKVADPAFMSKAYNLANNEVMMEQNRDALTAYINDPDKLTPTFQRVARIKREKKYFEEADKIASIQDYGEFVKAYNEATGFDNDAANKGFGKGMKYRAERMERWGTINSRLKDNENYKRYTRTKERQQALKYAVNDMKASITAHTPVGASDEVKDQQFLRKKRLEYLQKFLAQNDIDIFDDDKVLEALEETVDGQELGGRSYFINSKYGQFVENIVKNSSDEDVQRFPPQQFTYASVGEAFTAFKEISEKADQMAKIKEKDKEAPEEPGTFTPTSDDSVEEKKQEDTDSAYDDELGEEDDKQYDRLYDKETDGKLMSDELAHVFLRLMSYGFRLHPAVIETLAPIVKSECVSPLLANHSLTKEQRETIKTDIDNLINFLHEYAKNNLDKTMSPTDNFLSALNAALNGNAAKLAANTGTIYFIKKLKQRIQKRDFDQSVVTSAQKLASDELKSNAVESVNTSYAKEGPDRTFNKVREKLAHFADLFNTQAFLNSNRAGMLTAYHAPLFIVSGDALLDENHVSLNTHLKQIYGDAYDADKNGALAVVVRVDPSIAHQWKQENAVPTNLIEMESGPEGHREKNFYQVVAFLPAASENQDDLVSKWREKGALWGENEDRSTAIASKKTLYLHRNGLKYSFSGQDKKDYRPLNKLSAFGGFKKIFNLLQREHRKLKGGNNYVMLAIDATKNGQFSVFSQSGDRRSIDVFVAPMSMTKSISSKDNYEGESLESILNDNSGAGVDKLRSMHHKEVFDKEQNDVGSWGRMGHFFFSMRQMLLSKQYEDISNIIGYTKDNDDRYIGNKITLELPNGYEVIFDTEQNAFYLGGKQVKEPILLGELPQELVDSINEFRANENIRDLNPRRHPEYTDEEKQKINDAASLTSPTDVQLAEQIDQFIFSFAQKLFLDDQGKIASATSMKTEGTGENQISKEVTTERVKWNLYYGAPAEDYGSKKIQKIDSAQTIGMGGKDSSQRSVMEKIYKDFYDEGLLMIRDAVQSVFFTDDPNNSDPLAPNDTNVFTPNTPNEENVPTAVRSLIDKAKEKIKKIHSSVTSLTQTIVGEGDYFDSSSNWGISSTGIGNIIDSFAKDLFTGKITFNMVDKQFHTTDKQGFLTDLNKVYPNTRPEQLQQLAIQLNEIRQNFTRDGFAFVEPELYLNGTVTFYDSQNTRRHISFPVSGIPDVVAYNPTTGEVRIIDVKNKRSSQLDQEGRPKAVLADDKQKMKQYTAQVSMYAQMSKDMVAAGDLTVTGLYILEVPTYYPDPVKDNVSYQEENGKIMVTKNDSNETSEQIFELGDAKLHHVAPMDMTAGKGAIDVHARFRSLSRQLNTLYKLIDETSINIDKYPDNLSYQQQLEMYLKDAQSLSNEIDELVRTWDSETGGDLRQESGNINSKEGKEFVSGDNTESQKSMDYQEKHKLENRISSVVETIKSRFLVGKEIGSLISDKDLLDTIAKQTGEEVNISKYAIKFEQMNKDQHFRIDTEHGYIFFNEDYLKQLVEEMNMLSPQSICDYFLHCRIL